MLRAQGARLGQKPCSVREPAHGPPACDVVSQALRLRDAPGLARIDELQMDARPIGVSQILSIRRDVSACGRIAGRISREPAGLRFRTWRWRAMPCKPHKA